MSDRCRHCELPIHRYSPDFPEHADRPNLMGCVNSLRGEVDRLCDAIRQHRDDWPSGIGDPTPHDERLWSHVEDGGAP